MKRLFLLILLIATLFAAGCNLVQSSITEIEAVNSATNEITALAGNSEDVKSIISALNKKDKTDVDVSSFFPYELHVKENSNSDLYTLYFDLNNKAAYVSKGSNVYKIKDKAAKPLFLNENFSYIYIDSVIYESYLDYNGEKLNPHIEYDWTYKNIEGHFTKKAGTLQASDIQNENIPLSENDSIDIKYEKNPDSQVVRVYSQGNLAITGTSLKEVLSNIKSDGEYFIECQAQWLLKDGSEHYGNQTISFTANIDNPADIAIVTRENYPGNILLVFVENLNEDETAAINTDAVKVDADMYSYKEKNMFMVPIDLNTVPGDYKLTLVINDGKQTKYKVEKTLTVKNKSFKTQYLTVTDDLNETNNDNAAIYEFVQLVKPARSISVDEKLWEGAFIMPVEGELTTDFAEIRYVNNEQSSSRHSGLDIAAAKGTEVKAPNNGVVTFAMDGLLSSGNTLVIDHGMGLFTSYYHLDTIDVEKGDKVKIGDIIGTVGTTGFSTGPHLHYAVSIYNTYVNPYQTLSGIIE
ncbi:MAG: M23 family metallopeptidase [Sedimentibacter sp.]